MAAGGDEAWCRETVPRVMELVSPRLPQRDACALLAVSPWCHRALAANLKLWEAFSGDDLTKPSTKTRRPSGDGATDQQAQEQGGLTLGLGHNVTANGDTRQGSGRPARRCPALARFKMGKKSGR
uniref:Uncharacterized protein n=1 Tax=Leersia perrieri TaxID=77586 RepID=A0A0D9VEV4_9ORYZ